MQGLGSVTTSQLLQADQTALMKFEIYEGEHWKNICNVLKERLTDGAMELWDDATHLTHWTQFGSPENIDREITTVHAGTYSSKLTTTAGGDLTGFYQDITLTPGNKCRVKTWYLRAAHASSNLRLYITDVGINVYLQDDGTWDASSNILELTESAIWKLFELEFIAHPDYSTYRIRFYKDHGAGGAISYYVDSVSVAEFRNLSLGVGEGGNFLEEASISLGGAGKTPDPVAGSWDATLLNEDSIFHPDHPTSVYKDWLKTQRLMRISVGARYGGVDYFWQRLIGYMGVPKFSIPDYKVDISGGDYMKLLQETELRSPDNYWGSSQTFNSIASDGVIGAEVYAEGDAMEIGGGEANNVSNWTPTNCDFVSFTDGGGGSTYVGKVDNLGGAPRSVINTNVGNATAGKGYRVKFKHRIVGEDGTKLVQIAIWQASGRLAGLNYYPIDDWTEEELYFTASDTGAIEIRFYFATGTYETRLDEFSIKEFTPYYLRYYELPGASKGPYYLTLDGDPVWPNEEDEGWFYAEDAEAGPDPPAHPARIVWFDLNKIVANGNSNLVIYYFTAESPENAVARLLFKAGLYVDEAAALAAMDYDATGITIDKIWFKPGSTCLNAIKKLCERCNYRFHFKYDGTPVFKEKPSSSDALTDGGLNIWTTATNLTYWTEYKEGTSTINREATEKVEGDYSCRFDADASNSQVQIYQMNISLTPLKRRKVIIWYKNSVAGKTFQFYIRNIGNNVYLKEDGTWNIGSYYITLPNSIVWTAYELPFYVHPDYSTYLMLLREKLAASSSIYFDKVSICREDFTFTDPKQLASVETYQDQNEIKNRIVIEGMKQADPVSEEEKIPPELRGMASDATSIAAYGERTLTIKNHLFQTQAPINAMCAALLAERKDPKWYSDVEVPFNPAPIEMGDTIGWKERLSPILDISQKGIVRDIKIDNFSTTYVCELT